MFMCKECHEADYQKYHCTHFVVSRRKCEICGETKDCFVYKSYKQDKGPDKMFNICIDKEMNDAVANWCPNGCPEPGQHKFSCSLASRQD